MFVCLTATGTLIYAEIKRVPLSVTGGGSNLQARLTVCKGTGTDSANTVYLSDCRSDFADVRFYQGSSSGYTATEMPYWVYTLTTDSECTYYVKVPTVSASEDTTYLYVISGTPHTVHESNAVDVFKAFDNFSGTLGAAPTSWSVYTSGTAGAEISDDAGLVDLSPDSYTGESAVVGASSGSLGYCACRVPHQRMCFTRNGVYYVFVSNYDTLYVQYRYSTDGVTWSTPVDAFPFASVDAEWDIEFDGTYVHYCRNFGTPGVTGSPHRGIKYARGSFNADNSITFGAESSVFPDSTLIGDFDLAVDANGCPWLAYGIRYYGEPESEWDDDELGVCKSATNDGTWDNDTGFPIVLASEGDYASFGICCPLDGGNMYIVEYHYDNDTKLKGYLWDGAWSDNDGEISTYDVESDYGTTGNVARVDAMGYDNEVHITYASNDGAVYYLNRNEDGSFDTEVELDSFANLKTSPRLTFGDDRIYVTWADYTSDELYLRVCYNDTWGTTQELVTGESFNEIYAHVMPSLESYYGSFGLCYLQADYDVVHLIVHGIPPTIDVNTSLKAYSSVAGDVLQVDRTFALSNGSIIEFDININNVSVGSDTNDCFEICRSFNTSKIETQFCPVVYGDGNQFGYLDGSGHNKITGYNADTWYSIRIQPDYDTDTYNYDLIDLDGTAYDIATPSFIASAYEGNFSVRIVGTGSGHTGTLYFDNFRILTAPSSDIVFGDWQDFSAIRKDRVILIN